MIHIIDDEMLIRELLSKAVSHMGKQAQSFDSATRYLQYMQEEAYIQPSIILSDINMPEMTGCALAPLVKQQYPDTTFALMTGNPEQCTPHCCHGQKNDALIDRTFYKPFNLKELSEFIHNN
ncbi:MAG: hypothetical protein CO186_09700 [Zetaproteobacteria bacterium CG_4_9_14_3_um_filter_49_83]|nr:MAG: hypothetical protein AUJ56_08865 [Zetaproteobacteria bacterium CG1_02_49_23]PIQ32288.1 MAG: hypothetical protein COW62_07850 [Zetaproteobacteria bacterium CG17_big_fil_post_rev_8_21_14_2_50_50_13]PIV30073.1 MAG: hypothetical protein COS35_08720 [Zetaproteobacteria bacterium CG02_land_8_20_14_3_00_50_9]PIY56974.1 MAG: hypothetical protein COZ00_01265 [Zetaproteobacteria bacterium CG_4_10_14_0_8_um_filter_49_80]PJA34641.1 MAG: hypothetical protein CO186_09700 [Zetaproteobacteria bacterium